MTARWDRDGPAEAGPFPKIVLLKAFRDNVHFPTLTSKSTTLGWATRSDSTFLAFESAEILRWESPAAPETPLPQDDSAVGS